jgi:hypothetical protein
MWAGALSPAGGMGGERRPRRGGRQRVHAMWVGEGLTLWAGAPSPAGIMGGRQRAVLSRYQDSR